MWWYPRLKVLVVGGVHLDTIIDVENLRVSTDPSDPYYTFYSPGRTIHSIGGTGFNIAENLARMAYVRKNEVGLYTILAKDSAITRIIRERLIQTNIYRGYVHEVGFDTSQPTTAGGFVGVRDKSDQGVGKTIRVAATDTPVNQTPWAGEAKEKRTLEKAIKKSGIVVVESYIEQTSLQSIVRFAELSKKPLFVSLTSERSGQTYITSITRTAPTYGINCRFDDLRAIAETLSSMKEIKPAVASLGDALHAARDGGLTNDALSQRVHANQICAALRSEHIVCTDMRNFTYALLSKSPTNIGSCVVGTFPTDVAVRAREGNLTGVRDGLFSAFIHLAVRPDFENTAGMQGALDFASDSTRQRAVELASRYTAPIAQSRGATPGAAVSFAEVPVPWYKAVGRLALLIHDRAPFLLYALLVFYVLLAWLLALVGYYFELPFPSQWRIPRFGKH